MTAPSLTEARRSYDLARYGDASIEAQNAAFQELRAAERAAESLDERCFRLGLEAADLDARAGDLEAEAAQDELVVTVRRAKFGNDDATAMYIASRARVGRQMAAGLSAEADRLRSQAAAIRYTQRRAKSYASDVLSSLQVGE